MGKSEGKRQFARSGHRLEDNIDTDLKEIGWHDVEWIYLSHNKSSGGLPFQIPSNPHIMCIVQFNLRTASLNKPRDKDFYSFDTHDKVPPCIATLYMPWVMGTEGRKGLAVVFKLHEYFPARSALVPGIRSGSGKRVPDCTSNQRKTRCNIAGPQLSEEDGKYHCTV